MHNWINANMHEPIKKEDYADLHLSLKCLRLHNNAVELRDIIMNDDTFV